MYKVMRKDLFTGKVEVVAEFNDPAEALFKCHDLEYEDEQEDFGPYYEFFIRRV